MFQKAIKKCPNCTLWTSWSTGLYDQCEHCGAQLNQRAIEEKKKRENKIIEDYENSWLTIKPDDSTFIVIIKNIVKSVQLMFMAIVSFFLWLIFAISG